MLNLGILEVHGTVHSLQRSSRRARNAAMAASVVTRSCLLALLQPPSSSQPLSSVSSGRRTLRRRRRRRSAKLPGPPRGTRRGAAGELSVGRCRALRTRRQRWRDTRARVLVAEPASCVAFCLSARQCVARFAVVRCTRALVIAAFARIECRCMPHRSHCPAQLIRVF